EVRSRGHVHCGVSDNLPGFADSGSGGNVAGFEADFCRAVAAAIFGDAGAARFRHINTKERFAALQLGEFDLLLAASTWTMERDTALGLSFAAINYYDEQRFLARQTAKLDAIENWAGITICTDAGSTNEQNALDFLRENGLAGEVTLIAYERTDAGMAAYEKGECDLYTADQSVLLGERLNLANPGDHSLLPMSISKEPWG